MEKEAGASGAVAPKDDFQSNSASAETPPPVEGEAQPAGEQAQTEAPKAEATPSDEKSQDTGKKREKGGYVRKLEHKDRQIDDLVRQNQMLMERLAGNPAGAKENPPEASEPKPEQFQTWEEYNRALVRFEAGNHASKILQDRETKAKTEQTEAQYRTELQNKVQRYETQKDQMRELHEDFDDVLDAYDGPRSQVMEAAILESDMSGEIAYHIAKNPEDAAKLAKMGMIEANRFIAKLETKLDAGKTQAPKVEAKTTGAPPPVKPVHANKGTAEKDPWKMNGDEYLAWEKAQRRK